MRHLGAIKILGLISVGSLVVAALGAWPSSGAVPANIGPDGPVVGTSVPPIGTEFVIAALVAVQGADVAANNPLLYVSRKTFNRLRDEAGGKMECDGPGLQLRVTAGVAANGWQIPAGASIIITEVRHGVPVPCNIVAGDDWFLSGDAVLSSPCS